MCSIYECPLGGFHKVNEHAQKFVKSQIHNNPTTNAVLGVVHAGVGHTELVKILACMDIPSFSEKTFKEYEREVGPAIEAAARKSCRNAALQERKLVLKNLETFKENIPSKYRDEYVQEMWDAIIAHETSNQENSDRSLGALVNIIVSYDMGWSKRGNGRAYDSLNGYGAIIGFLSKKILDYRTRNRKCQACDRGVSKDDHDCRLSHYGSAKGMEASAGTDMILNSEVLKESGCKVKIVVGDEDSSSMASIHKQNMGSEIYKLADKNQVAKNVSKKIYTMQKEHKELLKTGMIPHIKKCFSYAVSQNKGNSIELVKQIRCIARHLYDDHSKCGSWCTRESGRISQVNKQKFVIKSEQLVEALEDFFSGYDDNTEKYCVAASSQVNEAFNHTVTSKFSKNKSFSTTESGDYRIAAAVLQKSEGERYIVNVKEEYIKMSASPYLIKHCEKLDKKHLKRAQQANTPAQKLKRLRNKQKRDSLRTKIENKEGVTYESNIGFKLYSMKKKHEQVQETSVSADLNFTLVYFDLETSGRSNTAEVLQLSATANGEIFNVYIQPSQPIDKSASIVNGLSKIGNNLNYKNRKVNTLSLSDALIAFSKFLKNLDGKSLLIAHNASFNIRYLLRDILDNSLLSNFEDTIYGFTDSLKLFRATLSERKLGKCTGAFKLETLASGLLADDLTNSNFHNAVCDVLILQKLANECLTTISLLQSAVSFQDTLANFRDNLTKSIRRQELAPLKGIVTPHMINKLAMLDVTYKNLQDKYTEGGEECLKDFLSQKIGKKVRFSDNPVILQKVVDHFER